MRLMGLTLRETRHLKGGKNEPWNAIDDCASWDACPCGISNYRGMKLWAAAVNETGSLHQEEVIAALDHARIAEGPGGPAEIVPGQHHVRMNMYIAQAKNDRFEIVESLGAIDPDEAMVPPTAEVGRGPISSQAVR